MEEEKIPAHTVGAPSPAQASGWASALERSFAGRKARSVFRTEDFVLSLVFDDRRAVVLSTHPEAALLAVFDENLPSLEELLVLRENIGGLVLTEVRPVENEPAVVLTFTGPLERKIVWEGMKRSSNVLLLDAEDKVIWALRSFGGEFRRGLPRETWRPPPSVDRPEEPGFRDPEEELHVLNPRRLGEYLLERARTRKKKPLLSKIKSLEKKRDALSAEIAEAEKWLEMEPKARALVSSGDLRRRGETSARITDYSADPPAEEILGVDPTLTILENAEKMFRQARKGRERIRLFPGKIRGIDAEINRLRKEVMDVESVRDLPLLYPSPAEKKKRAGKGTADPGLPKNVVAFDLPREFRGYAGKNAAGNDHVSFRIAKGEDFWFHVADYKGSHVVVRNPSRLDELPLETEMAAARYAALHSSAPADCSVEVTVTKVKFLSRVRKTPGAVYVSRFRRRLVDLAKNG